jgi:hypothetical protein
MPNFFSTFKSSQPITAVVLAKSARTAANEVKNKSALKTTVMQTDFHLPRSSRGWHFRAPYNALSHPQSSVNWAQPREPLLTAAVRLRNNTG